jgi:toxin ParE1/3/4
MPRILIRPRARGDLIEIWNYIADDGEVQADAFIATIDRKFEMLAKRPLAGRRRDELSAALRSSPVGRYVVFYVPLADGIEVIRVLHSAQDLTGDIFDAVTE